MKFFSHPKLSLHFLHTFREHNPRVLISTMKTLMAEEEEKIFGSDVRKYQTYTQEKRKKNISGAYELLKNNFNGF